MKKTLLILLSILIVLPLLLLLCVAVFIDPIVRVGVEKAGSLALKVPVHLKESSIRFSGHAALGGFEIGNPPGYTEPRAVAFERVETGLRPSSLLHDVVELEEVTIIKPELTLEFSGTKSNWSVLMDNLGPGKPETGEKKEAAPGKKFIIHRLRVQEAGAHFRSDLIPGGTKTVTLPSIDLENVGTAEGGATMGQVLSAILHQLGDSALKAGQGVVPSELLKNLGNSLKDLRSKPVEELEKKIPENLPGQEKLKKGIKDRLPPN